MITFSDLSFIADIDCATRSSARRDRFRENRAVLRGIKLERLSRIGDSDDPFAEFQETQDKKPSDEATTTENDASLEVFVDRHDFDFLEKVVERQRKKV